MKRIATVIILFFAAFSLLAERRKPLFIGDLEEGGLVANKIDAATDYTDAATNAVATALQADIAAAAQAAANYTDSATNAIAARISTLSTNTYTKAEANAAITNTVTTSYIRERLGVYLYVGEDGGIYVHTNED